MLFAEAYQTSCTKESAIDSFVPNFPYVLEIRAVFLRVLSLRIAGIMCIAFKTKTKNDLKFVQYFPCSKFKIEIYTLLLRCKYLRIKISALFVRLKSLSYY